MTDPQDWRLQGQDAYLADRVLTLRIWQSDREGWDHDHCSFCWAKFGTADLEDVDHTEGYVTSDGSHWVCRPCFDDFRDRFGWTVES